MDERDCKRGELRYLDELASRYPQLEECRNDILQGYFILEECFENGNKLLTCGNGGSAADSEHIVGELMKSFHIPDHPEVDIVDKLMAIDENLGQQLAAGLQHALPAIALSGSPALSTAFLNDCEPLMVFAQQVYGLGLSGDVLLGISTSGSSKNVAYACVVAKAKGMKVIGLTGKRESVLSRLSDVCVRVPEIETFKVQELHLPVYHCWCAMAEERFFGNQSKKIL